jgi:hypothetical protein
MITDKYIIKKSQIFFIFEDKPLENGILDMVELLRVNGLGKNHEDCCEGPIAFDGSDDFVEVIWVEHGTHKINIYLQPDG